MLTQQKMQGNIAVLRNIHAAYNTAKIYLYNFWRRWKHEYILPLPSAHHSPGSSPHNLAVGDIVIVDAPSKAQFMWPLARIEEVYPGNDGIVRACLIHMSNGKVLKRPAQNIHYLEIAATPTEALEDVGT